MQVEDQRARMAKPNRRSADRGRAERAARGAANPEPPIRAPRAKKTTWRYVALGSRSPNRPGETDRVELGILLLDRPRLVLWGPDSPPAPLPRGHAVLKEYSVDAADPSTADWLRAQLEFARDFPPRPVPPAPTPAWLAPDGRFYACRWLEHDRLSYRLAAAYYADPRGTQALERHGWLRVQRDGTIVRPPLTWRELTQPQLDVLFTLVEVSRGDYHANIRDELELARLFARLETRRGSEGADTR